MNPKSPSLIARSRYDTALARAAYRNGFAPEFRIVPLLHAGEEGIEVAMDDAAFGTHSALARVLGFRRCIWNRLEIGAQHGFHG
jgi:hypothetical protein